MWKPVGVNVSGQIGLVTPGCVCFAESFCIFSAERQARFVAYKDYIARRACFVDGSTKSAR